ncbi:hypothetical protein XENOCAPTIV_025706, partial [Xenoophorus captivus]
EEAERWWIHGATVRGTGKKHTSDRTTAIERSPTSKSAIKSSHQLSSRVWVLDQRPVQSALNCSGPIGSPRSAYIHRSVRIVKEGAWNRVEGKGEAFAERG